MSNGDAETRLCKDGDHFGSIVITAAGALGIRPHPGDDPNGWGTTVHLQSYLSNADTNALTQASISVPEVFSSGITVNARGSVTGASPVAFGNWSWTMTFVYDGPSKTMTTSGGSYVISLLGVLGTPDADLNLCLIASNYLTNVPLLVPPDSVGDTGDMAQVVVSDGLDYTWNPPAMPAFYPQTTTDKMTIDVVGQRNVVDTAAQGLAPIAAAYKPSVLFSVTSHDKDTPLIFGAAYAVDQSTDFAADNVGITPLILRSWTALSETFDISVSSTALPGDGS